MGVRIHYRGTLNEKNQVYNLIEEVKDVARTMGWSYAALDEDWTSPPTPHFTSNTEQGIHIDGECGLKGIHFRMGEDADAVWLYFNAKGNISAPFQVALEADEDYPMTKKWLSTKTQDVGIDTHIALINFFKYLKEKYIENLEVIDNGGYWEHNSKEELKTRFNMLEGLMNQVDNALENIDSGIMDDPGQIDKMIDDLLSELGEEEKDE